MLKEPVESAPIANPNRDRTRHSYVEKEFLRKELLSCSYHSLSSSCSRFLVVLRRCRIQKNKRCSSWRTVLSVLPFWSWFLPCSDNQLRCLPLFSIQTAVCIYGRGRCSQLWNVHRSLLRNKLSPVLSLPHYLFSCYRPPNHDSRRFPSVSMSLFRL